MIVQASASDHFNASPATSDSNPVALLFAEVNALAIRLRQHGRPVAGSPSKVPGAEHAVLEIINRFGAMSVPQIARQRSTSRQNIQILVDRLESEGRVELVTNPAHKRSALVRLTQKGRMTLDSGSEGQKQLLAEIESELSQREINAAVAVLSRIQARLSMGAEDDKASAARWINPHLEATKPEDAVPSQADNEEFPLNLL